MISGQTRQTSSAAFFEEKYQGTGDPWNFAADPYENARYGSILRALGGGQFHYAFEPGCSIGVLTRRLADFADTVVACDFSPTAAAAARERCATIPNVGITCRALSADEPWQRFDLVVLSEIGYYFSREAWRDLVSRMGALLPAGALVLGCHWLGHSADHVQHGDEVHAALQAQTALQHLTGERCTMPPQNAGGTTHGYRIDLWRRR